MIAGNHSFDSRAEDYFKEIGIKPENSPPNPEAANSLLIAFAPPDVSERATEEQKKGVWYRFKYKLSPYEFTSFHLEPLAHLQKDAESIATFQKKSKLSKDKIVLPPDSIKNDIEAIEAKTKKASNRVFDFTLPFKISIDILICAEALQSVSCDENANMLIICAHHKKPEDFDYILNQTSKIQKLSILASEGRYGGSTINLNIDRRFQSWWQDEPHGGKLPAGNGILFYQLPYRYVSASAGSTNPFKEHK